MSRSRVSLTVLIGDMISDSLETEYVTAGIGRRSAVERKIGSRRVLCEQINKTPDFLSEVWLLFTGGGGFPLTVTRTPSAQKA